MKRTVAIIATLALLVFCGQAFGELCTIDAVPAATLLLPYFEVNANPATSDLDAITTIFSVNNASAAPVLAHVTFWTNLSLPVIDFDLYLTGYDVQTINLRSIFLTGNLPVTAMPGQGGGAASGISKWPSDHPAWGTVPANINEASCDNFFPFNNPTLSSTNLARLNNGHMGTPVSGSSCLGLDTGKVDDNGDPLKIGYITIDSVNRCSVDFPGDTGYFVDGGVGVANNNNQLWGDYFIIDPGNAAAFGDTLVHIEADATVFGPLGNNFTFYSRYDGGSGIDNREPLANAWATRYQTGGAFSGGTRLAVWRDSRVDASGTVPCGTIPWPDFLEEGQVIAFDEMETAEELCEEGGQVSPPQPDVNCFPLEVNWTTVGEAPLDPTPNNGWLFLNLDLQDAAIAVDPTERGQAYVTTVATALGLYEVGYPGIQLNSACNGLAPVIAWP